MHRVNSLKAHLCQLADQAEKLDRHYGPRQHILFDNTLFHCRSHLLAPCVQETYSTFETIIRNKESNRPSLELVEYLTQKLMNQINAISKELASHITPNLEVEPPTFPNLDALHHELVQHEEWERRLTELVKKKQHQYNIAQDKSLPHKALTESRERLTRCQHSKIRIKKQIRERKKTNDTPL